MGDKKFSKHKYFETQNTGKQHPFSLRDFTLFHISISDKGFDFNYLGASIWWHRKIDHGGVGVSFQTPWGHYKAAQIYDERHWDDDLNDWVKYCKVCGYGNDTREWALENPEWMEKAKKPLCDECEYES